MKIYSPELKENMEGSFAVEEEGSPSGSRSASPRTSPRAGRKTGVRSAPTGASRAQSPRSAPRKSKAASPVRTARSRGTGEFFINPETNRVVNMYRMVKGERQLNSIYSALKNDGRGDMTANLTFYATKEEAEAVAKDLRSSTKSTKKEAAAKYWVDKSKGKYVKGGGRRGRIVVIHKPKGGDYEGPFASKAEADAWAVDNGYLNKASAGAAKPRGAKTGPCWRVPGVTDGWNNVTQANGKENPKLTLAKAGKLKIEYSTWEKVKAATLKSSQAKASAKKKEYTQAELDAAARAALAAGVKQETVDKILDSDRSSGQKHATLLLQAKRPQGGSVRSGYCIYSVKNGKKDGQPRSIIDTNGELTSTAYDEAAALTGKKRDTLSRAQVIAALQKAIRDGTRVTGPGGKKCAARGEDGYHDLMRMK